MRAIDADTHIDETEQTWEYLDEADHRFKPIAFELVEGEPVGPGDGRRLSAFTRGSGIPASRMQPIPLRKWRS